MEVPVAGSDQIKWVRITVASEIPTSAPCCTICPDLAGSIVDCSLSRRLIIWRVHTSSPTTIEVFGMQDNDATMSGRQLVFGEPLSPYVAVYSKQVQSVGEDGVLFVCAITISGILYILRIRRSYMHKNVFTLAKSDMMQFSLSNEIGHLEQITAFAGLDGNVCIGGKNGSILCYNDGMLDGERECYFELKDPDAILGRLWGFVARGKTVAGVQCLKLQNYKGQPLLFALHEDGTFKLWDLRSRSRLLNIHIYRGEPSGFVPRKILLQEQDLESRSVKVGFLLEGAASQDEIHIYDLQLDQTSGSGCQIRLQLQLRAPVVQGTVLDVKILSDRLWKLEMVDGMFHLDCCSMEREEVLESCELLEAELEGQLFQCCDDNWEDLMNFQKSISLSSKADLQLPVSALFTSRILQPGVYQQHSLHEVLQKYKRNISETDLGSLLREGLETEILTIVETQVGGNSKLEQLSKWRDFCRDYMSSWKSNNVPYTLVHSSQTSIGLIRRHGVSFRRSLTNFERICQGFFSQSEFLDLLFKCMSTIVRQIGKIPCAVFGQVLVGNPLITLSHLCSIFLHYLDVGYVQWNIENEVSDIGVDIERRKAYEYRQQHQRLELQLILSLHKLRDSGGGWSNVLDNIERYINQFEQDIQLFRNGNFSEVLDYGFISKRLVLKSTSQLSWTFFEAARDLLIFLSYLIKIKGQIGISNKEVSRIQMNLIVHVKDIFFRSLLVHWLSINFAEVMPPEDFSLHLSTLHLDSGPSSRIDSQHVIHEVTLSEIILSACHNDLSKGPFSVPGGILSSDHLLYATKYVASWLMWGADNHENRSLTHHSVTLAVVLLQHGQYAALQKFLELADKFCNEPELHESRSSKGDWCARLHLLGCGLLGQSQSGLKESVIRKRVAKAVHYFFKVAFVVGQETEDLSQFFSKIGMEMSYLAHKDIFSTKFHYFEWVMQIFEQNRELEGACQFAYAALQEADVAVRSRMNEDLSESASAVLGIKGRLWANVFKFCLDRNKFKEAYCAIMSNPDNESKFVCLRRFLIVLCEQKAAEVLCGSDLPYTGMLERVEHELLVKARHSDLNANPNPFKLLYSFHMQRSNWRRAALYMYIYYLKMKEMGLENGLTVRFVLQEQLNSLAAAINALHLVEARDAWLDVEAVSSVVIQRQPSSKRMRIYASNDVGYAFMTKRSSHVDMVDLKKDYTFSLATLLLIEAGIQLNIDGEDLSPENLVTLLVQSGHYEMAFTVLVNFWKDSSVKSPNALIGSEQKLLLLTSSNEEDSAEGAKRGENISTKEIMTKDNINSLQSCLEKYGKLHPHLPVTVAEALLTVDRLMDLPYWLVDMLKGGRKAGGEGMTRSAADPSSLFRLYLDFGRVTDAALLFLEYMKARCNLSAASIVKRKKMCSVWFPYTLVDRLRGCLSDAKESLQVKGLQNAVESCLALYFEQVKTDSMDVKSLVQK
ncbi:hypothetical protein KP509_32G022400 [Ceratopteris richardii]|uniref:Nuclear pore complex protein NUP160 domain-containing protein n=1 Tax=Ceratopteris richardii TaxID=49495 RepID=A0A8T2QSA2_CERRI|nr:hypothetical protein KP509_32G022400 [Ceratopteris richardii]